MNTKRYIISLSLALALGVSTGALASQANHENQWSNVVSYGETTIAQDSPEDFGSWKMMVQPAAGPTGAQPPAATPARPLAQTPNSAPIPKPARVVTLPPTPVAVTIPPAATPPVIIAVVTPAVVVASPLPPALEVAPPVPSTTVPPTSTPRGR